MLTSSLHIRFKQNKKGAIMNLIGRTEGQEIQVELKYCERCGGLWLRPQKTDGVFCASCRVALAAMPDPGTANCSERARRRDRRQSRVVPNEGPKSPGQIDSLLGIAAREVRL
jgi:Zn-finger nucleic acid-binding protein